MTVFTRWTGAAAEERVTRETARREMVTSIREWYEAHADDVVIRKGVWFVHVTVRVRDLRRLIERMFGITL